MQIEFIGLDAGGFSGDRAGGERVDEPAASIVRVGLVRRAFESKRETWRRSLPILWQRQQREAQPLLNADVARIERQRKFIEQHRTGFGLLHRHRRQAQYARGEAKIEGARARRRGRRDRIRD